MSIPRSHLISLLVVVAMWSITLTFSATFFWAPAVVAIVIALAMIASQSGATGLIRKEDTLTVFGLLLLLAAQVIWGALSDFYNLREIFSVTVGVFFALLISKVRVSALLSWIPYYGTTLFFLLLILQGVDPEEMLARNSRNFLSVILLGLFASAIVLSKPRYVSRNHLIAASLLIVVSFVGVGRSGIISSALLMAFLIAKGMFDGKMAVGRVVRNFAIVVVGGLLVVTIADSVLALAPRLASRGFHDFSRMSINLMYFYKITPLEFVFGRNYFEILFLHKFDYNLHNSYLAAWANIGIFYIGVIAYCLAKAFLTRRFFPYLWIVLVCLGLRAATDIQMIGAKYDYVFLMLVFLSQRDRFLFEPKRQEST